MHQHPDFWVPLHCTNHYCHCSGKVTDRNNLSEKNTYSGCWFKKGQGRVSWREEHEAASHTKSIVREHRQIYAATQMDTFQVHEMVLPTYHLTKNSLKTHTQSSVSQGILKPVKPAMETLHRNSALCSCGILPFQTRHGAMGMR